MRPDLDDFDDMNQDTPDVEPRSRAMSWLVLGVAVTGFAALAYYAYQSGTRSMGDNDILEVAADDGAIKEAPADAGGEEFPHQDKTIYDALTGDSGNQKVEKLLPEPEEPIMPEPAVGEDANPKPKGETTTYVKEEPAGKAEEEDTFSAPPPGVEEPKPAVAETPKVEVPKAVTPTPTEPKAEAPKVEAATPAAATGDYKIQLGAFSSEAEAQAQWKKISAKHSSMISGSPIVVRADLDKGTFYRLRTGGFASAADAKAACKKLDAARQPCMVVGK